MQVSEQMERFCCEELKESFFVNHTLLTLF